MNRSTCVYVRIEREDQDQGTRKLPGSEKERKKKLMCGKYEEAEDIFPKWR